MSVLLAVLLAGGLMAAAGKAADSPDESIEVRVRGTLRGGIMAIGGETTGYTVTARGVTWELDFGTDEAMLAKADGLDGKKVVVVGTLESRRGVEIAQRSIVNVQSIEAVGPAAPKKK